ncbi:hypothetical protein [Streptomyces longwoodensis]
MPAPVPLPERPDDGAADLESLIELGIEDPPPEPAPPEPPPVVEPV